MRKAVIIQSDNGEYAVTKIFEVSGIVTSKIMSKHDSLQEAKSALNELREHVLEDAIPANSIGSGHIAATGGDEPPAPLPSQRKKRKRDPRMMALLNRVTPIIRN